MKRLVRVIIVLVLTLGAIMSASVGNMEKVEAKRTVKTIVKTYHVKRATVYDDDGNVYTFKGKYTITERIKGDDSTMTLKNKRDRIVIKHVVRWTN